MAIKFLNSVIKPVKSSILKTDPDGVLVAAVAGTDYLSSISSSLVTTALGFTPVPTTRTITINGTALDLSANRSYTISTITGNAGTATTLQTARTLTIGSTGKTFNGSANVSWSLTEIGAAAMAHVHSAADITSGVLASARLSGTYGIAITGNAASANILSTSRTFTIGNTAKGFNGSGNVSWTLAEIGAIPSRSGIIKSGGIVDTTSLFPFSITTAQTAIGFEYNILLNAQKKGYTVTQSGTGQIGAPFNLFDGRLEPNYSGDGVNPADPFVLLIEGLPGTHTQTGGVFGWTCRYWVPTIYKVEAFDSYNNVGWKTLVDQQSPLATKDLVIPISQSGLAGGLTKFRITIYDSNGATGANGFRRWGISEIFFIHPEAQATHQFLDVEWAKKLSTARTIGGVSFDGSANINLPGVNTTGNQNTTGSAGTVTGSSTIDGYLTLNTNWGVSPYTSAFNIIGTYPSMTFRGSNGDTHYLIHMDSGGNIQYYFGPGHLTNNWTRRYEFTKGGNFSVLTGNISASGTVTASGGNSTQWNTAFGWGDHDGLYATTGYVDTAIANLVDTAPDALNTLNELSAALGDDPNFATTIATAIGGKADASHTHEISDINNLQTELDGKQPVGSYAAASHTHAISDVTGLQSALDGKQPTGSYAAASHTHDDRYYTESEIDSKLVAMTPFQTTSDFTQGTLIRTNINAAGTNGDSFLMQLVGKSYTTGATPFDMLLQGYIYNNTFISYSALVNSSDFPAEIVILEDGGNLCFWFARYTYWNSFEIKVTAVNGEDSTPDNRIVSVVNSAEPASAKKVRVIPIQSWNSADFSSSQISNWNTAYNWGNHAGLYAAASHTHAISNVTGLQTALDGKQAAGSYLTSLPAHTHDDRYYTESEVNSLLSSKANTSHKYHTFSAGNEYYDSYGQENNLRLFTENATFDNFRFRSYSNVEYFDGTNWVAWGQSLDTLFDGREETGISLGHANSHFRFEINRSSGWPTTALFVIQSSWTDTNSHTCEVTLETWNGSAWVQKDNWTYSDFQRGINLHTTTNVHDGNAQMRVTINMDWVDASHNYYPIRRILLLSNFSGTAYDMQPFTWDYGKNVTFASQIYVSGGNSSQWNTSYGWGNHAGLYSLVSHTHTFASITSKPTTLSGYGITDAATSTQGTNADTAFGWGNHAGLYSLVSHTHTFASLTSKPTTLVGYGITDAATSTQGTKADSAYGWGNHASAGYLTAHPSVTASVSSNNSGRTYIQDILLDGFGHITGITTATETVVNTDTNYYTTGATFSTSTGVITLTRNDGTTVTVDIDGRYLQSYTETDTLSSVVSRGSSTTSQINVGAIDIAGGGYTMWVNSYAVSDTNIGALTDSSGNNIATGGAYRVTAHISGTGTDQSSKAVIWNQNGTWYVNETTRSGSSSNHIQFLIHNEVPSVKTWHSNNYNVSVLFERINLYEDTGTDNTRDYWGTDSYMSNISDNVTFNLAAGGSVTAPKFVKSGGTSSQFLKADGSVDTNTYLTAHPSVSATTSSNNSGRTYIQDILLDGFGHITGITTATETVVNTDTNYYTTGSTFNSTNGIATFTRNDGGTYTLNLLSTLSDVTVTGGTYNSGNQTLTLTKSDGNTVSVSGFAIDTDVNWYTTGATFSTSTGVITFTRNNGGTYTVDIDGKYAESGHNHNGTYMYAHVGNGGTFNDLTGAKDSNYVTFDATSIVDAPSTHYYNGFVSTHANYLSSYILQKHRTDEWYLGWRDNSTTPSSTWVKVWHDGNLTNLNQLTNGPGYITEHPAVSAASSSNNGGRTYIQDILLDSFGHITGITTATETVVNTDTNYYTTGSTFNTTNGIITFTRNDGGTYTVDVDGKYAEASHTHSYVPLAGGTMTGSLLFSNDIGTAIQGTIGTNDFWRIYASSTASNAGYLEISTSDDGTEPIYVRQYTGVFATLVRTATLLDGSGNTSFPNTLTAGTIVKSGGTSLQYLMADGSVSTNPGWLTTHPTIAGASSNNSGRTYIQDILTDGNGHVTGITTASETVVNTDTNYYVSSAAFNTGDGVLTLSRNGLSAVTVDLDGRYQATGTYLGAINYNNDSNANYQLLWGSGNAVYGTAGVYLNPSTDYVYGASFNASDWFRSSGNTGWYNSTYSGGWYMTDSSYIRPYNGKSLSMDNGSIDYVSQLHFNDNVRFYDEGNNQYLNYKWGNSGAGGIKFVDGDDTLQGYVYGSGTGSFGLLDSGSNWKVRVDSSNVEMYGTQYLTTVYANFIYDRDNTAYYLNPAGGSNLNTLTLNSTTAGSTVLNVQGTQGQLFSITDDLTGDLFSVSDASGVPIFNVNANGTVSIDSLGSLVIGGNPVLTAHPSVTAAGSSNNSGRTYIQDILLDAFGHITGITTATETVVNTDTNTVTSVGIVGDLSTGNITLVGSGSTTVTKSGGTITITSTDTNTTYSVGDGGLTQFNFTTAFRDKLNGIEASANNYVHPTTTGNKHIPTGGSSGQILRWSADGTASWGSDVDTNTTYTAGTGLTLTGTVFSVTAGTYAAASHTHTFASLTSKPTTISGYGITDAITTGNIGSQSVDYATRSKWIDFPDGPRDLSDRRPDWNDRSVAWDFVTAASVGGAGQYAGVMTFSPWDGTAASTGDSSYQLAFHNQTGVNSSGAPGLKIRNGIDATWKSWRKVALVNTVTFSNVTSVTFEHGLGTDNVVVQVYDGGGDLFFPSAIRSSGGNVSVVFEIARSGRVVVTG